MILLQGPEQAPSKGFGPCILGFQSQRAEVKVQHSPFKALLITGISSFSVWGWVWRGCRPGLGADGLSSLSLSPSHELLPPPFLLISLAGTLLLLSGMWIPMDDWNWG